VVAAPPARGSTPAPRIPPLTYSAMYLARCITLLMSLQHECSCKSSDSNQSTFSTSTRSANLAAVCASVLLLTITTNSSIYLSSNHPIFSLSIPKFTNTENQAAQQRNHRILIDGQSLQLEIHDNSKGRCPAIEQIGSDRRHQILDR
jgi:hypothetical protein